jgi:UDP-2,3-diacylglucosamine pyrophosphatase LpxH
MKEKKRRVELVAISDVHLGTYGSHAKELNNYLQSIKPEILVLNGDIIDFWQFSKRYWPKSHMKVVKTIISMAAKGTLVYYITGNHDETLRKFSGTRIGNIEILNKLELELNGEKTWFFHGDVFDVIMQHSKWLAKLGAFGYDSLIMVNVFINFISRRILGRGRVSLSKKIKDNVKSAIKYIHNYEGTAASLAVQKGFHTIVCGHIHQPQMKELKGNRSGNIRYLNSGDWIENLTALEYNLGKWTLYYYNKDESMLDESRESDDAGGVVMEMNNKEIFRRMVEEFQH